MERVALDQLVLRRKVSKKNKNATLSRAELEQHIADFYSSGGKLREIPPGVSGTPDGLLPPTDTPGAAMAVVRPNKNQAAKKLAALDDKPKYDPTEGGKYINQQDAAFILGVDPSYIGQLIKKGVIDLKIQKKYMGSNFLLRSDVEALPPYERKRPFGR